MIDSQKRILAVNAGYSDSFLYGFTTRHGGCSVPPYQSLNLAYHVGDDPAIVEQNQRNLALEAGFNYKKITWATQVHEDQIYVLHDLEKTGHVGRFDAIITNIPEVPLLAFFADCIPVLIFDPVKKTAGVIHAGWKGTWLNIVSKTVNKMVAAYQCDPADIIAVIGPGICATHYEINAQMYKDFSEADAAYQKGLFIDNDRYYADLIKINSIQLSKQGIVNIYDMGICPYCRNQDFFSYRKEKGVTGRFSAFIMIKNGEDTNESQ